MGALFGLTPGRSSAWVQRRTAALSGLWTLHKPARRVRDLRELLTREPALQAVVLDGAERRRPRPLHAGRRHDLAAAETARRRPPKEVTLLADSGFLGWDAGPAALMTPWKKPKGRPLHWKRRACHRLLARERVKVEHPRASVKRLRIPKDEWRNRRQGRADEGPVPGCALHNDRWTRRQGPAA